jgi:hypothetical protein
VPSPKLLTQGTTSRAATSARKYRRAGGAIAHAGRIHPGGGADHVGLHVRSVSAVSQPFLGQTHARTQASMAPRRTRGRCPPRKAAERPKRRRSMPKSGPAMLYDRCARGTPRRPPTGSEAPVRAQPSPVSTLGGHSGQRAPRERCARPRPGDACGVLTHPAGSLVSRRVRPALNVIYCG